MANYRAYKRFMSDCSIPLLWENIFANMSKLIFSVHIKERILFNSYVIRVEDTLLAKHEISSCHSQGLVCSYGLNGR